MNSSDNIQLLLQQKIDQYKGVITPEILNRFSGEVMKEINQRSLPLAEGLSPEQLHQLLHFLFTERSIVRLSASIPDDVALKSPLLNLCICYLQIIQREKEMKLTKTGALPMKIVNELYSKGYISEVIWTTPIRVRTEQDSISIQLVRVISKLAGMTKMLHGKLSLTAKGTSLLKSPSKLLILFNETFFLKFSWSYFDLYDSEQAAQFGAGYTLVLLRKYGHQEKEINFYAQKFLEAFPMVTDEFESKFSRSPEDAFCHCYITRTFHRGLMWLGMVETRETGNRMEGTHQEWVKTTSLFHDFLKFNNV